MNEQPLALSSIRIISILNQSIDLQNFLSNKENFLGLILKHFNFTVKLD